MGVLLVYQKIRELSRKICIFEKNVGKHVRLHLVGNYQYIAEPIEMKEMECFFKLIGKGMDDHPLTSQSLGNIKRIVPI